MPYVTEEFKQLLDPALKTLAQTLDSVSDEDIEEVLSYTITETVVRRMGRNGWRYKIAARASAVFGEAQAEFRRRIVASYKDQCITKNGDIEEYKQLLDSALKILAQTLDAVSDEDIEGVLNYTITDIVVRRMGRNKHSSKASRNCWRNKLAARTSAVFGEAQAEFRRQIMAPYEDQCIAKNGDIEVYDKVTIIK
jgi:CBS-domain-containing membrane protein